MGVSEGGKGDAKGSPQPRDAAAVGTRGPLEFLGMPGSVSACIHVRTHTNTHAQHAKGHKLLILLCDRDESSVCL